MSLVWAVLASFFVLALQRYLRWGRTAGGGVVFTAIGFEYASQAIAPFLSFQEAFDPVEFGNDEVFLADNPGGEVLDGDSLTAFELLATVRATLTHDAVNSDHTR